MSVEIFNPSYKYYKRFHFKSLLPFLILSKMFVFLIEKEPGNIPDSLITLFFLYRGYSC